MNDINYELIDELAEVFTELLTEASENGMNVEEYATRWNNVLDRYESENKYE